MVREALHGAGIEPQAADFGRFVAAFEQRLHAQADSQERNAGGDAVQQRLAYGQFIQRSHHLAKVTHARQDDLRCGVQSRGVADQGVFAAEFTQGILHAAQIAGAIIENGDHNSPFVDGN